MARLAAVCVLLSMVFLAECVNWKPRFEYKYSFKGPHLVQSDKSIPFFEYGGDAIASDENIRITPSLRSKKGWVWTKNPTTFKMWSVELVFKISGRGRVGADGMAFWFTEQKGQEGPVFGSSDQWKGLGVFMDSFDNDGQHNNPYIMAMANDGTKVYDHHSDGLSQQLGGCLRDFRNKPYPVRIKVEYYNKILTVFVNNGLTNNKDDFELCLRQENVELPDSGYFGVSAATGGLAGHGNDALSDIDDDHDVVALLTHSLVDLDSLPQGQQMSDQERQKYDKEFEDYQRQLEAAKQEFQKQHPNADPNFGMPSNMYEAQGDKELRMIFEGQTDMHNGIKQLSRKLDELLGRQELILTRIGQMGSGGGAVQSGGQQGQQQQGGNVPYIDTIQRHEVDKVFNNQNDIIYVAREIKNLVSDVQQRANYIQSNLGQGSGGSGGQGQGFPQDMQNIIYEMQNSLKQVRSDTSNLLGRPMPTAGGGNCPPPLDPHCVTSSTFFIAIALQIVILIGYMIFRQSRENQAKKFY